MSNYILNWIAPDQTNLANLKISLEVSNPSLDSAVPSVSRFFISKDATSFDVGDYANWDAGSKIHAECITEYFFSNNFHYASIASQDFVIGEPAPPNNVHVTFGCASPTTQLTATLQGFTDPGGGIYSSYNVNGVYDLVWGGSNWAMTPVEVGVITTDSISIMLTLQASCNSGVYTLNFFTIDDPPRPFNFTTQTGLLKTPFTVEGGDTGTFGSFSTGVITLDVK